MHKFKTCCTREKLKEIREFISESLEHIGMTGSDAHKLILAVDEVCSNLIIHGNKCSPSECLEIYIEHDRKGSVVFDIVDYGPGFNYYNYKEPTLEEMVKKRRKGGLGIILVRKIMDSIEFSQQADKNICRMRKSFRARK